MALIDPTSGGFQFALLFALVFMIAMGALGWRWKRDLWGVIIAQGIAGVILFIVFPEIAIAFG